MPTKDIIVTPNNKWLKIKKNVVLTTDILPVITGLDVYFGKYKHPALVTSGLRSPQAQLDLICQLARDNGLLTEYPNMYGYKLHDKVMIETGMTHNGKTEASFVWQRLWSRLLNVGIIVNPPLECKCLFDYWKDGVNKIGTLIPSSKHSCGLAFDIGGASGQPTIEDELPIVEEAYQAGDIEGFASYQIERKQNCIHINCRRAVVWKTS